jgi:hypothetical protein
MSLLSRFRTCFAEGRVWHVWVYNKTHRVALPKRGPYDPVDRSYESNQEICVHCGETREVAAPEGSWDI